MTNRTTALATKVASAFTLSIALVASTLTPSTPASAAAPEDSIENLTLSELFPGTFDALADVSASTDELFGSDVVARVPAGTSATDIASKFPLHSLYDEEVIADFESRITSNSQPSSGRKDLIQINASAACYTTFPFAGCGIKFTNFESRVIANAVLGGSAAGYQYACSFIPNPLIQAACRIGAGAFFAGVFAFANFVLNDSRRCLFYSATNPVSKWGVVTC